MSATFDVNAHCLSQNPAIVATDILHKPVCISLPQSDAGQIRYIHGLVRKITQGPMSQYGVYEYNVEVVPWLWFLTLNYECRIFQNKNAKEIIEQVFQDRGFSDFRFRLSGNPPKRDYCVQYRESDFNFVSRLMEEEGIFYFFEHTKTQHTLILGDANSILQPCPFQNFMPYTPGTGGWGSGDDTLIEVERQHEVHTGKITRIDYDFIKPSNNLKASVHDNQKFEEYDYPGKYTTMERGDAIVKNVLEEREANFETVAGVSAIRSLVPGYKAEVTDHYRTDINAEYIITSVEHQAGPINYVANADMPNYTYRNRFTGLRSAIKFRPPLRARKPVMEGEQTAVVVGPPGEEIYTDEYGRVKVHFHWDREGKKNQDDSCWIRVSHAWAGANYGGIYIPRIGQEVIVGFLEGDPDQPIITGRLYNALQMPPYPLPANKTRSTIRSHSSKGGGASNTNEIRFEDMKGCEQLFIHAEKDVDIWVKNNWRTWIGYDYHRIIKGKVFEAITKDCSLEIKGDRKEKIFMNHSQEVGMSHKEKIGMNLHQTVGMNHHDKVGIAYALEAGMEIHLKAGLNLVIESGISLTLKVGGNFVNISPAGIAIQGTMVLINSGGAAGAGGGCSPEAPDAPECPDTADNGKGYGSAYNGGGGGGSNSQYTQYSKGGGGSKGGKGGSSSGYKGGSPPPPPPPPQYKGGVPGKGGYKGGSGYAPPPPPPPPPYKGVPGMKGGKGGSGVPETYHKAPDPYNKTPDPYNKPPATYTQEDYNKLQEDYKKTAQKGQETIYKGQDVYQKGAELVQKGQELGSKGEQLAEGAENLAQGEGDPVKGAQNLAEGGAEAAKGGEDLAKGTEDFLKGGDS